MSVWGITLHQSRTSSGGGMVRPEQSKVAAIQTFEVSNTKKEMETLLLLLVIIFRFVPKVFNSCSSYHRSQWEVGTSEGGLGLPVFS